MKKIKQLAWLVLLWATFFCGRAQENEIMLALKKGDAAQMARYFDQTVELVLPDSHNSYNRTQAEALLRDFFQLHPIQSFETLHKGEQAGAQYCIGQLKTRNGVFRTTVYLRNKAERQWLQELRFERR